MHFSVSSYSWANSVGRCQNSPSLQYIAPSLLSHFQFLSNPIRSEGFDLSPSYKHTYLSRHNLTCSQIRVLKGTCNFILTSKPKLQCCTPSRSAALAASSPASMKYQRHKCYHEHNFIMIQSWQAFKCLPMFKCELPVAHARKGVEEELKRIVYSR